MKIELDKEFTAAALDKQVEKTELPDEGIVLNEPMEPENADCSVDTVPADVLDTEGRKKVRVPELISMTKVLFDRYRLPLYAYLIRCLRNGTLESLVQKKILNHTINREVAAFPYVTYWRIDRENFYADIEVELKLKTPSGPFRWKGWLVCWCSFTPKLSLSIEYLTGSLTRSREEYDLLSRYLVPYSTNSRVDEISENIWKEFCPEALTDPSKRSAEKLAKRMGLTITHRAVYDHHGVDSILFFKDDQLYLGEDRYEKEEKGKQKHIKSDSGKPVIIPANTIVVNSNRIRQEYSGFHIFHECYHYQEHYLFYCLQELASNDFRQVPTREVFLNKDEEVKDSIYFLEKQADRGALGLMMPATDTRRMIHDECSKVKGYSHAGELYDAAGTAMRRKLYLPDFRIRTRMIQLGHLDAKGALNYVEKSKIEPFAFEHEAWSDSEHTFIIDPSKVNALMSRNKEFRDLMDGGRYIYADGHVVRNLPKYVRWDEEREQRLLTDWAKEHVDKCCLRFVQRFVQKNVGRYVYGRMYYDPAYVKQCEFYLSDLINEKQMNLPDAQYEYEKNFPETFKEAFETLMHKNGETQETMADKLCTTRRSLREWLKNPERKISADFIIYVSQMWKLPDFISSLLLESAGICLNRKDPRCRALEYIRTTLWDQGIDAANTFLTNNNMEILTI
ncbi:MAG TPA: hypothetical protein DCG37_03325 [Lachnospiraceae bacterium]|nr:hypothetical protein [Lachnospiraceae bacterium]